MGYGSSFRRCADSQQSGTDHTKVTQKDVRCEKKNPGGKSVSVNELRRKE